MRNPRVGLVCNIRRDPDDESQGEFDEPYAIEALESAIGGCGCDVEVIEADAHLAENLRKEGIAFAFNVAEGVGGRAREAYAPAVFEMLGIPYLGSDVTTMSVALDKDLAKRVVASHGVRVPQSVLLKKGDAIPEGIPYPVIVKPNDEGSSKGIHDDSVAQDGAELRALLSKEGYGEIIVERYVDGREFTVGIIGNGPDARAFEPMEIVYSKLRGKHRVYSYEVKKDYEKYISYRCPPDIPKEASEELKGMASESYLALSCRDLSRFDFRMSPEGEVYFIEANPLPGLAPGYSDYPMLAGFNGVGYEDLIRSLMRIAFERNGLVLREVCGGRVFEHFGVARDSAEWNDWRWQYAHRITDAGTLAGIFGLSEEQEGEIDSCLHRFRMAITPYFATLVERPDYSDPIWAQCVPSPLELVPSPYDTADPLNEEGDSPVPNIIHRYPDRVLFLVTRNCPMYCRYCTRRRIVGEEDYGISDGEIDAAVGYVSEHEEVRDVLISGGDPLTIPDGRLERILSEVRAIPHVEIVRIGTRAPLALPMRITRKLTGMLGKYHPLWVNVHTDHPRELTPEACAALGRMADAGIPIGNQSVLLRGINDDPEIMKRLVLGLVRNRVRPYYLFQCDLSEGLGHFRTDVRAGIDMVHRLQGNVTGFAVPRFVIDSPGGGGKVPIDPGYVVSIGDDRVVMRNYEGKTYVYPQPPKGRSGLELISAGGLAGGGIVRQTATFRNPRARFPVRR